MYKQNRTILMNEYPDLFKRWQEYSKEVESSFQIKTSDKGIHYIEGELRGKKVRIHSTYNPAREAESVLNKYKEKIEEYEYILFWGMGLGYHIALCKEKYPDKVIFAYEPNMDIFSLYLQKADISLMDQIFVGTVEENLRALSLVVFRKNVLLIPFPVYEILYAEEWKLLQEKQVEVLKEQKATFEITSRFEKRWVLNALYNYPSLVHCPSVVHPAFKEFFQDKPIVIVGAGPSLNEEIENLRKIKEEGIAYIFTVGSAVNALLSHGITPDATCSYDPSEGNLTKVYRDILDTKNDQIPLLFGSTFMTEVVKQYPGKKAYFILSQDLINPVLCGLPHEESILDAPTVVAVLLQILLRWQVRTIIFVGQNLAYRDNQMYAEGIDYTQRYNHVERAKEDLIPVESVTGKTLYTSDSYLNMKEVIEQILEVFQRTDTINTTVEGAKIKGTVFMPLDYVMKEKLCQRVVEENWYDQVISRIPEEDTKKQQEKLKKLRVEFLQARDDFEKKIRQVKRNLSDMEKGLRVSSLKQIARASEKYEKSMQQVERNPYYCALLVPFLKVYLFQQNLKLQEIRHRKLAEKEFYQKKYEILHEAIQFVTDIHEVVNRDVQQVLVDEMKIDEE